MNLNDIKQKIDWTDIVGMWILASLTFSGFLFANIIMGVVIGVLAGWLFSLVFLGTWVAAGLNMMHINILSADLYKFGAALGFISGFFKFSFSKGNKNTSIRDCNVDQ